MDNANSPEYLEKIKNQVIENMKRTTFAPSVQMTDVPRDPEGMDDEADAILDDLDEDENKDKRFTAHRWDKYVEKDGELSESEDEEENSRNGVRRQNGKRRMNIMDYRNPLAAPDDEDSMVVKAGSQSRGSEEPNGDNHITTGNASVQNGGGSNATPSRSPSVKSSQTTAEEDTTMLDAEVEATEDAREPPAVVQRQEVTPPESPAAGPTASAPLPIAADDDLAMEEASPMAPTEGQIASPTGRELESGPAETEAGLDGEVEGI